MSHDGCRSRSRARGTTTDAPTQARAGTAPLNPPRSTRPPKPLPPHTIIRIPPNRPSSRAEATGSSLIQPRVGLSKAPPSSFAPTCLTQSSSFPNSFLFPASFFTLLLSFDFPLVCRLLVFSPCSPIVCNSSTVLPIIAPTASASRLFCCLVPRFLGCHDVTLLQGLLSFVSSTTEGNMAVEGFECFRTLKEYIQNKVKFNKDCFGSS